MEIKRTIKDILNKEWRSFVIFLAIISIGWIVTMLVSNFGSSYLDIPQIVFVIASIAFVVIYPIRIILIFLINSSERTQKAVGILGIIILSLLLLFNPSEKQFHDYAKAHVFTPKYVEIRTSRETNYLFWSKFYTRGQTGEGYYIGVLGNFYHWEGAKIQDMDYE